MARQESRSDSHNENDSGFSKSPRAARDRGSGDLESLVNARHLPQLRSEVPSHRTLRRTTVAVMMRLACVAAAVVATPVLMAASASADPAVNLQDLLPAGYTSDTCQGIDRGAALAAVSCGPNSLPGGPTSAIYQIFVDDESLQSAFSAVVNGVDWTVVPCPGAKSSGPTPLRSSTGATYGSVACGRARTFQTDRDGAVVWTRDADKFLGVAWVGYQGQSYPVSLVEWVRAQGS